MIEDRELREIYQISGAEHVQNLEAGLLTLEKNPDNTELLQTLLREAHSLKGDSRVIGVKSVEALAHRLEEIIGRIKNGQMLWSQALGQRMYQTIGALGALVHEAVTDEPSGVDPEQLLNLLSEFLPTLEGESGIGSRESGLKIVLLPETRGSLWIEDADLRDIYQISSEEHLNKLQSGLMLLDENPDDRASLEELLNESQSFELDSRIVGQESLETVIHKVELIFESLQSGGISFPQVSYPLHSAVDAIAELVKEALTGKTATVNLGQVLRDLDDLCKSRDNRPAEGPKEEKATATNLADMARLDTIRVPMRYLDALMTHTGELTVTKTRLAHTGEKLRDLLGIWDSWKTRKNAGTRGTDRVVEEKLDSIIRYLHGSVVENNTRLDLISRELDEKIRTLRLLPLSTIFLLFPRLVRELAQEEGKEINFVMEGGNITVDKQILEEMKDPLLHLLRNAVDHAIETPEERRRAGKNPVGQVWLKASRNGSNIVIEVGDDGRGLDLEKIKQTALKRKLYRAEELAAMGANQIRSLIFLPGFSTRSFVTEISGRGVGLDVVRSNVERLKGTIAIESSGGTTFRIQLRSTVATLNVMLVGLRESTVAIPIEAIEKTLLIRPGEVYSLEGQPTISVGSFACLRHDKPVTLVKMADILELPSVVTSQKQRQRQEESLISIIVLNVDGQILAFEVDRLLEVLDVVIKPQTKLLKRVRNIMGATILGTGDVCMILNPQDLINSVRKQTQTIIANDELDSAASAVRKPVILLVEDSIAVRTQEKRILDKAGYEVIIAVDGVDGYNKLRSGLVVDGIISDVEMPNMDGLTFTAKVRQHPEYRELPLILVTSLAKEEDKRRGAQAGANAYIVKDQFNQELLIETLERLV